MIVSDEEYNNVGQVVVDQKCFERHGPLHKGGIWRVRFLGLDDWQCLTVEFLVGPTVELFARNEVLERRGDAQFRTKKITSWSW
jgi:hypothetical protein